MRIPVLLSLILLGSQAAFGQSADCRAFTDSAQRLACYDKTSQSAAKGAPAQQAKKEFVDPTLVDESAMKTRIKSICRGC